MEFQNNMLSPLNALSDKQTPDKGAALIGWKGESLSAHLNRKTLNFKTVAQMRSYQHLEVGQRVRILERNASFDVVESGTVDEFITLSTHGSLKLKLPVLDGYIHAKHVGVKGDGTGNDAPAIQAAIDYLNSHGGGRVSVQGVVCRITEQLYLKDRVELFGGNIQPKRQNVNGGIGVSGGKPNRTILVDFGEGNNLQANCAVKYGTYTKISGVMFAYPAQVDSLAQPKLFPPTLAPDSGFTQYVDMENLEFHGSYEWMRLDSGLAGRIQNIKGHLLHTGIWVTNAISPTVIDQIEAAAGLGSAGSGMRDYANANAVLVRVAYADDLTLSNLKAVEIKTLVECNGSSSRPADSYGTRTGSMWGQILNPLADVCREPIVINDGENIQIQGGSLVGNTDIDKRAGAMIKVNQLNHEGSLTVDNVYTKNCSIGVHVKASRGTVAIAGVSPKWNTDAAVDSPVRYGNKTLQGMVVVNENQGCHVTCDSLPGGKYWASFISGPISVGGVMYGDETSRVDVTPANIMNIANWSSTPLGMGQIDANTIQFDTTVSSAVTSTFFGLPNTISEQAGVYQLEFDIEQDAIADDLSSDCQFNIDVRENGSNVFSRLHPSNYYPNYRLVGGGKIRIKMLFVPTTDALNRINVTFGKLSGIGGKFRLSNMKVYKLDNRYMSQTMLDGMYGSFRYKDTNRARIVSLNGLGNITFKRNAKPLSANGYNKLDECISTDIAVGKPQGWVHNGAAWVSKALYV